MLLDLSPLKQNREYRLLYFGQFISFFGTMVTYVAVPYQIYQLTKDNALVGSLGIVQLVPLLIFGLIGGTYADRINRRKMLLVCEMLLGLCVAGLAINAMMPAPSVTAIFILVAISQGLNGFHRPAMDAMTQTLVSREQYAAIGALNSFRYSVGAIAGPALGGGLIAAFGIKGAFVFDAVTFPVAFISLYLMKPLATPPASAKSPWADAKEGLKYALSKPELVGTYIIDLVAMIFAFPVALFPAMSDGWGGAKAAGILFSSMAIGSLIVTAFSGWSSKITHHGRLVVYAATAWAVGIVFLGQATQLWLAVACLAFAGGADMISGLFRGLIWNETIPNTLRGRLSGIEMISYMAGPLLGNARAGWMAAQTSVATSVTVGGVVCAAAVIGTAFLLPQFWRYQSTRAVKLTS
ncbi:MAG: MFS transporter [Bdellovibrionales bacterium]|nr:MFS transporter [Bdellovibrionales bacterium]